MIKYIALSGVWHGKGATPEEAIEDLQNNAYDYDGDRAELKEISVFEVQRAGKAKITFEWKSI